MTSFYETDLGVSSMTAHELDTIALERGGRIGSIGYGFATRGQVGQLAGGWTACWIATGWDGKSRDSDPHPDGRQDACGSTRRQGARLHARRAYSCAS